jgi:hypothetical protein
VLLLLLLLLSASLSAAAAAAPPPPPSSTYIQISAAITVQRILFMAVTNNHIIAIKYYPRHSNSPKFLVSSHTVLITDRYKCYTWRRPHLKQVIY